MKSIVKISLLSIVIFILGLGCASTRVEKSKDWSYEGYTSEIHWADLKSDYKLCKEGVLQSPINIVPLYDVALKPLKITYVSTSSNIVNNGHTIQVNINEGSFFTSDTLSYELKQFHFHTPSEHNIYGKQYPLEAHFVHTSKDGNIAVIAVIFKIGKKNKILENIWNNFPLENKSEVPFILSSKDIKKLMPSKKAYYKFLGSLTTPPCTQGVKWYVYKKALSLSEDQVNQFFDIFGHDNNREIQKTNGRIILK